MGMPAGEAGAGSWENGIVVDRWFQKIAGVGLHRFNSYMNVVTLRGLSSTGYAQRGSNATL